LRRARELAALAAIVALAASCGRSEPSAPASTAAAPAPAVPQAAPDEGSGEASAGAVSVEIAATVDGAQYPLKTMGQCTYTGAAAVYDVPAAQWHAMVHANGQPLSYANLTIWEFKDHSTQASLGIQIRGEFRHLSTVKGATLVGSGTARAAHAGEGATLSFEGKDNRGAAVQLEVHCPKATAPIEEGGS
jgi:hypothetical protein